MDRVEDLVLQMVVEDDGDPDHLVYHNDLERPIVSVDVNLDEVQYPRVIPLQVVQGGSVGILSAAE